jgi:hypothetical protein
MALVGGSTFLRWQRGKDKLKLDAQVAEAV